MLRVVRYNPGFDPRTNSTILGVFRGAENDAEKISNRSELSKVDF